MRYVQIMNGFSFPRGTAAGTREVMKTWEWLALTLACLIFLAQTYTVIPRESATFDEQYHLTAGYSYLRTRDFRLASNHPPLMGMLGGLGLFTKQDVLLNTDDPAWTAGDRYRFSDVFLWESSDRGPEYLVAARRMMLLVGLALLLVIFFAAREMVGPWGGWLALLLAVFDSNLLFHTRLVTTDLGVTLFVLLSIWLFWRWMALGARPSLLGAGVAGGLAMAAKYTGLMVWPLLFLIALIYPGDSPYVRRILVRLGALLLAGLAALITLWAVYRFDGGVAAALPLPFWLPAPFYWENLYRSFSGIVGDSDPKLFFLLGQRSLEGWWYYFPVVFSAKTPLPTLALMGSGLFLAARDRRLRSLSPLWIPPLCFLLLGMTGYLTIGYRHILPALPFLLILAGYTAEWTAARSGRTRQGARLAMAAALVWLVMGAVRIYPHHGSYFNEAAGPWQNWSNIAVDSNLDWGQDLPTLRTVMEEREISVVNLAYFGKAVPERYGVRYRPLPGFLRFIDGTELNAYNPLAPAPGWYAISATSLQLGLQQPGTEDLYAYFRGRMPDARAGYSIYLYHVEDEPGQEVVRRVIAGAPGWQHGPAELAATSGARVQLKWIKAPDVPLYPLGAGFAPPEGYTAPDFNFSDAFTLLGYQLDLTAAQPAGELPVTLVWQAGPQPFLASAPTRGEPLATFAHLVDSESGSVIAQFDGWPTALAGLEPGDIIVQNIRLSLPEDMNEADLFLRVGLYSPQNGQRLPIINDGPLSDFVELR